MKKYSGGIIFVALAVILAGVGYWIFAPGAAPTPAPSPKLSSTQSLPVAAPSPAAPKPLMPRMVAPVVPPVAATTDTPVADEPAVSESSVRQRLAAAQALRAASPPPTSVSSTVLGEVEFSDGQPRYFTLVDGRSATITPHVRPDGNLGLDVQIKSTDARGIITQNQIQSISMPGQEIQIGISSGGGTMELSLKPKLAGP